VTFSHRTPHEGPNKHSRWLVTTVDGTRRRLVTTAFQCSSCPTASRPGYVQQLLIDELCKKGRKQKIGGFFIERFSFIAVFFVRPTLERGKEKEHDEEY